MNPADTHPMSRLRQWHRKLPPSLCFVALGALLLVAAIWAAAVFAIERERHTALADAEKDTLNLATAFEEHSIRTVRAVDAMILRVLDMARRRGLEAAQKEMKAMRAANGDLLTVIGIADQNGDITASSLGVISVNIARHAYFQAHARRADAGLVFGLPVQGQASGEWTMHVTRRINQPDGSFGGIVTAGIDLNYLNKFYREIDLGEDGLITLVGRDGHLRARGDSREITAAQDLRETSQIMERVERGERRGTFLGVSALDGVRRVVSFRMLSGYPLIVTVGISEAEALRNFKAIEDNYVLAAIALTALVLLLAGSVGTLLRQQVEANMRLRASEARFRAYTDLGADWYWESDAQYRLAFASSGVSQWTGRSWASLAGKSLWDVGFTPAGTVSHNARQAIAARESFRDSRIRYIAPDGEANYFSASGEPVHGADGQFSGYRGICRDITGEVRLQQRLHLQNEASRLLTSAQSVDQIITALLREICETFDWVWGARRVADRRAGTLACAESWCVPEVETSAVERTTRDTVYPFRPYGIIADAIESGEPQVRSSAPQMSESPRADLLREAGIQEVIAIPIPTKGTTCDVLQFCSRRSEHPDPVSLHTLRAIAREIGEFLASKAERERLQRERDRATQLLEQSAEHYRHLFETNPMPMWIARADTLQLVLVNAATVRLYGYSRDEFGRMTSFDFQSADGLAAYEEFVTQRRAIDGTAHRRARHRRKDGSIIDVDVTSHPINYGGTPARLVLAQDVTERLKAEATLRERDELLSVTFDKAPIGVNIVDLTGHFLHANSAYTQLVGYSEEELRGMSPVAFTHPEDAPRNRVLREELLDGKRDLFEIEKRYRTKDDRWIWVRNRVSLVRDSAGNPKFTVAAVQDITERKCAEQELQRKTALAQLLESLARAANEAGTPGEAMQLCLARICEHGGWCLGRLGRFAPGERGFVPSESIWHESDPGKYAEFKSASLEPRNFSHLGRFMTVVMRDKRPVWVEDITVPAALGRLKAAAECGLRAAFAFPVSVRGEIVAILEFYAGEPRPVDPLLVQASASVGAMLARLIERSEAAEERERLAAIVANSGEAIWSRAADHTLLSWNAAAERLFGWKGQEVIGKRSSFLVPPDRLSERQRIPERLARGEDSVTFETVRLRKDGRLIEVEIRASAVRDAAGKVNWTAFIAHDIGQRKQVEAALRESEARYRTLVENSPYCIHELDLRGKLISMNRTGLMMMGVEKESAIFGLDYLTSIADADRQRISGLLDRAIRGEPSEFEFMTANGRTFQSSFVPIRDAHGAVQRLMGLTQDVTGRKHAETELRRNTVLAQLLERLARAVNESITPDAAVERCLEHICEYGRWDLAHFAMASSARPAGGGQVSLWHAPRDDGRFSGFMGPDTNVFTAASGSGHFAAVAIRERRPVWIRDISQVEGLQRLHSAVETGLCAAFGFPVFVGEELVAFAEFFATEAREADGTLVAAGNSMADQLSRLIERDRAFQAKAELAAIVETATVAIISRTLDGKVLTWNPGAETMLGYTAAEAIGRSILFTIPPHRPPRLEHNNESLLRGEVVTRESDRLAKDGRVIDVLSSHSPIRDGASNIVGASVILQDITERKAADRALRAYSGRLQALSRKVMETQEHERASIARELHDQLGQMLSAVKLNLQVFQRRHRGISGAATLSDTIETVDNALQQVRTLALDLRPPQLDELGLGAALRSYAARLAKPAGIKLQYSADELPELPPQIDIACFRVAQGALTNVVRHANAANVWVGLSVEDGMLRLSVRDDGCGCDLRRAQRQAGRGYSMGLLSMEERTRLAGGRFSMRSEPGAGVEIHADFPLALDRNHLLTLEHAT